MQSATLSKIPSASEFAERIHSLSADIKTLAIELANALSARPELRIELQSKHGIARGFIDRLEGLGRGQIHEKLTFTTTTGGTRLLRVPLSEQALALDNGIEVLDEDETTTRNLSVHELTSGQAQQVIAKGHIRSLAEQRTFVRKQKAKVRPAERDKDFTVEKGRVITMRPGTWTRALVLQWLSEME